MVGIETSDDAAVYRLNDEQALIATTDFFMPIVDDPHDFGRIAATNAISDVYAMGGRPIMALAIVGMPINVLSAGYDRANSRRRRIGVSGRRHSDCGWAQHRFRRAHLWFGGALGLAHPDRIKRNADAQPGDVLVLGKPLGVGVLVCRFEEGSVGCGRLRADDGDHDPVEYARPRSRRARKACMRSPTSPASASPVTCVGTGARRAM